MTTHGRNHWIKLYVEMNHDPKIGLLTDDLKWRFTSVLLLAGEVDDGGFLPEINDMAWQLHAVPETVAGQMRTLALRGLVELRQHPDGSERWFVTKFSERQAPSTNSERQRQWRKRNTDNADVTKRYAKVTPEAEAEAEAEAEGESGAIAPMPTPVQSPQFQNAPPAVKAARKRRGDPDPSPAVANAPPAVTMLHQLTSYWPGDDNAAYLVDRLGDAPDEVALAAAVKLWRASGNKINNWAGICDWYDELLRDPAWTPAARFKNGKGKPTATSTAPPVQLKEIAPGLY